jgi:MOSC domain-containing protein YiiM
MKLLSVNVGLPREIEWKGKLVRTSIFKAPVQGRVRVARLNLEGDQQSDLSVHGGIDKAVSPIHRSITHSGVVNFLARTSHGEFSVRTLQRRV